jgi:hypothetical protein
MYEPMEDEYWTCERCGCAIDSPGRCLACEVGMGEEVD